VNANDPQPRSASFWVALVLVSAGVLAYVTFLNTRPEEPIGTKGPAIGRTLGYLELEGLTEGAGRVTRDDLSGRVTLVNYWGTWCPPCLREFPQIARIAGQFRTEEDFRLYAVSCGQAADPSIDELREPTAKFLESRGNPFPAYADQNGASRQAMVGSLGVEMVYPTTLLVDRGGVIRGFWQGYHSRAGQEMSELIELLLRDADGSEPPRHKGTKDEEKKEHGELATEGTEDTE